MSAQEFGPSGRKLSLRVRFVSAKKKKKLVSIEADHILPHWPSITTFGFALPGWIFCLHSVGLNVERLSHFRTQRKEKALKKVSFLNCFQLAKIQTLFSEEKSRLKANLVFSLSYYNQINIK